MSEKYIDVEAVIQLSEKLYKIEDYRFYDFNYSSECIDYLLYYLNNLYTPISVIFKYLDEPEVKYIMSEGHSE